MIIHPKKSCGYTLGCKREISYEGSMITKRIVYKFYKSNTGEMLNKSQESNCQSTNHEPFCQSLIRYNKPTLILHPIFEQILLDRQFMDLLLREFLHKTYVWTIYV
jgi:hypothetical protein